METYGEELRQAIAVMMDEISSILNGGIHSAWLYGSVVLDDFRLGWSDIDFLVLTKEPLTEDQAERLLTLRQAMTEKHPGNPYYHFFEGVIARADEYRANTFSRLVYWGTSGQRITGCYTPDVFSLYELAKYGKLLYGQEDRSLFPIPGRAELIAAVRFHYETIRTYAAQTDERLSSCGWLLDIARCVYTLRYNDVITKTQAGTWALKEHLFPDEEPLVKTLEIRRNPLMYKDREDVKQWLRGLGPVVQQYADALARELEKEPQNI